MLQLIAGRRARAALAFATLPVVAVTGAAGPARLGT